MTFWDPYELTIPVGWKFIVSTASSPSSDVRTISPQRCRQSEGSVQPMYIINTPAGLLADNGCTLSRGSKSKTPVVPRLVMGENGLRNLGGSGCNCALQAQAGGSIFVPLLCPRFDDNTGDAWKAYNHIIA